MKSHKGITGGIPDKLGNRYEAKWLVRCFMDLIANNATWLKFEGIDPEYEGFEFAIARGEITEWHQTKINASKGNWTLNKLNKEGILSAFSNRLSADNKAQCFFVSQDNAVDFKILTDKARTSSSLIQYHEALAKDQEDHFQRLVVLWKQSEDVVYEWLTRSYVVIFPERELENLNETYGDFYFHHGGKGAFPILRDILEKSFNKKITTESARQAIKLEGSLKFKEWQLDPTIPQRLWDETSEYLKTYTPFGAGGEIIPRPQTNELIKELSKPDDSELMLLTGVAGSGKSGVIRSVINTLRKDEIPHLAFRVDHFLQCNTREELGKKLTGREESPVSTLKGTYTNSASVLIIDQVDAISEVSGRDGQVKEVIFRLITDAHNFGGIKVIVVCRTFDLDSDPRLKSLKAKKLTKQIDVPLLDWNTDIEPILKKKSINTLSFSEPQRQLLCLPINLTVFLEIGDPNLPFHSISGLHEALIHKKQRFIPKNRTINWSPIKALTEICNWMADKQKLSAPVSILDYYSNAIDVLASEGLIIVSRGEINFFHESFFDHLYARAFVNKKQTLVELLTSSEQYLFRRTQVRQILESLRQNDTERYLAELSEVLSSQLIRFHIKLAICQWLYSVNTPTEQEFQIVSTFDKPDGKFQSLFRYAVFSLMWFLFLFTKGWIELQLNGDNQEKKEEILWWLSNIVGEFPDEVTTLLRSWWDGDPERANRLLDWFGCIRRNKPDELLLGLCEELIISQPNGLFQKTNNDRVSMLLHTWGEKYPEQSGKILQALFTVWFVLHPEGNPFANDNYDSLFNHSLSEMAEKVPSAFLQGTTDALVQTIDNVMRSDEQSISYYELQSREYSNHGYGFDALLIAFRVAFKKVLEQDPNVAITYLDKLDPFKHECLMHLHLEAIQASPEKLANRLPNLITDPTIFTAGFNGSEWWSFAKACHVAFPLLNIREKTLIEQAILNHNPEIKQACNSLKDIKQHGESEPFGTKRFAVRQLNYSGYKQWCILDSIGDNNLSSIAFLRLNQLRRKFPDELIDEPNNTRMRTVGSPIKQASCEKMSDKNWLNAINRYDNNEERRRGHNFVTGGANELARQLQELTKKNPDRFACLSLKISDSALTSYIDSILQGLADTEMVSEDLLIQAIKRADMHPNKLFGREIARLAQKHPYIANNNEVLELLIWYALNGEASEDDIIDRENTKQETVTIESLLQSGGGLHIRGINGTRGWMWEALAAVLWEIPELEARIWDALDIALETEKSISVRCCLMKPLTPLFNKDKKRFSESLRKLITLPKGILQNSSNDCLSPLVTHQGIYLFQYIFYWIRDLADEMVAVLLESGDETKQLIGAWLIFCESFRTDDYIEQSDQLATISLEHRKLLADVAADAFKWTGNRMRAECLLKTYFFDGDENIRRHAADVFRITKGTDAEKYLDLAMIFINSPAFSSNTHSLLHLLEEATCDVLGHVIAISERLLQYPDKNSQPSLYHFDDILKREYTLSESQPKSRKRILDTIDLMLEKEIYDVKETVSVHDRW